MLLVTLNWRRWKNPWVLNGVYLVCWRVVTVESGRALRVQMMEGLALACVNDRIAPASARTRFVRAVRNMVEEMRGDNGEGFLRIGDVGRVPDLRIDTQRRCFEKLRISKL
jgi:hypothetical protein